MPDAQSAARRRAVESRLRRCVFPTELPSSLVARFGAEAPNVIATATCDRPTDPVADGIDVIRAEFEYAVTHEGALTVDDIVDRRTRIGLVDADRDTVLTWRRRCSQEVCDESRRRRASRRGCRGRRRRYEAIASYSRAMSVGATSTSHC